MGYYTDFDITVKDKEYKGANIDKIVERLKEISQYSSFDIYSDINFELNDAKWYSYKDDMIVLSKEYPECEFIVEGVGERLDDEWKHIFINGEDEKVCKENGFYQEFNLTRKPYQSDIVWKSKETTPAGDPFMTVKRARGYYYYAERGGKDSIAFILYDKDKNKYALIYESKPPMDETLQKEVRMMTAFGGSIDMNCEKIEIVQTEVKEEAGYEVPLNRIELVGKTLVSTQMSQMCYLYFVDVTGINKTLEAEYEKEQSKEQNEKDPNEFKGNEVRWLTKSEVMENQDWKSIYILSMKVFEQD